MQIMIEQLQIFNWCQFADTTSVHERCLLTVLFSMVLKVEACLWLTVALV